MTQLVLNIDDPSILPTLKRVVKAFKGVTINQAEKKHKCSLDEALEDVRAGRVYGPFNSVDELFKHIQG